MTEELKQLREALRRVKYEAVSLADAQVIALEALTTSQPAQAGEREAWVPYLVDRADGVKGHYAIGRWNPRGYREVWNLHSHRWAAYSDDVMSLEEADSLLRQITIPTARASLPTQPAAQAEAHPLASRCYTMSESHLSGYRLILGFETMDAAQAAHAWVANLGKPAAQATPESVTPQPLGYIPTDAIDQIKTPPRLITHKVPVLSYAAEGYTAIYTHPAPGVPDGEPKLTQEELLEVAKHAWLMARTADSLQFYRTLLAAAAQAKGGGNG